MIDPTAGLNDLSAPRPPMHGLPTHRFRLGIIGTGLITQQSHLPAALASSEIEVAALIDPVIERAEQLARSYGIRVRIAKDVNTVADSLDGVLIATPNHTHMEIALACISRGIATLVEKPLAASLPDAETIVSAGVRAGVTVAVGYVTRFRDSAVLLKELIRSAYFGHVTRFVHQFGTPGGWAPLSAYNLGRSSAGGGVLVVTGTHFLDRALDLWGYPDETDFVDDSLGGPEANCVAHFVFRRAGHQFEGWARYSKTCRLPGGLVIETEAGVVTLEDSDSASIILRPNDRPEVEHTIQRARPVQEDGKSTFQLQLEDFAKAVRQKLPPRVDGHQALLSMRLIDELYARRHAMTEDWYPTYGALA